MSSESRRRRELLINGRRVRVSDLIEAGLLDAGQLLVYQQRLDMEPHRATVTAKGRLALPDGREYNTPSGAAAAAAKLGAVAGWIAWRVGSDGPTLHELRQRLLKTVATEVEAEHGDSVDNEVVRARFERLNGLLEKAQAGQPETLLVRQLLKIWGFDDRDSTTTATIQADLDNHGLTTVPDFRAVTLDSPVRIDVVTDVAPETSVASEPVSVSDGEATADIGLTLGNLLEDRVLCWVPPTATFEQAITAMQLDDYSQLAVIENSNLVGAVTWKSLAEARHHNPDAPFHTAIDRHAKVFNYDRRLLDVIADLRNDGFIFVRDPEGAVSGIITSADVVGKYHETAAPFFLIGEIDQELRQVVQNLLDDGVFEKFGMKVKAPDKMTMYDYQEILAHPDCWTHLGWPIYQESFVKRLDEIRKVRNTVAHFNRDPVKSADVERLRNFLRLIRRCTD